MVIFGSLNRKNRTKTKVIENFEIEGNHLLPSTSILSNKKAKIKHFL